MSGKRMLDTMHDIDDSYILEANNIKAKNRSRPWVRVAAVAACLMLVCSAALLLLRPEPPVTDNGDGNTTGGTGDITGSVGTGEISFYCNGTLYVRDISKAPIYDLPAAYQYHGTAILTDGAIDAELEASEAGKIYLCSDGTAYFECTSRAPVNGKYVLLPCIPD